MFLLATSSLINLLFYQPPYPTSTFVVTLYSGQILTEPVVCGVAHTFVPRKIRFQHTMWGEVTYFCQYSARNWRDNRIQSAYRIQSVGLSDGFVQEYIYKINIKLLRFIWTVVQ